MGISLALPISYSTAIRGDSSSHFRADLHTFLDPLMVWSTITSGYVYTLASSQGLGAKLRVWDPALSGLPDAVALQVTSLDSVRQGFIHYLNATSVTFAAHGCPCQLLLSTPAQTHTRAFQCGIPFSYNLAPASACVGPLGPGTTEESWWSNGDGYPDPFTDGSSFRCSFESSNRSWSVCYNSHLVLSSDPWQAIAQLRLIPQAIAAGRIPSFYPTARTLLRGDNGPLYLDPMIAWGDTVSSPGTVKGQLYNCVMPSADRSLDTTYTVDGIDFVNYMHDDIADGSKWSSLFLVKVQSQLPTGGGLGNYVY